MNDTAQNTLTLVPSRLFFSTLPNGDHELSCFVCFPATDETVDGVLRWTFTSPSSTAFLMSGSRPLTTRERTKGRCLLSCSLPNTWESASLHVEVSTSSHSLSTAQWVTPFAQTQAFELPLMGTMLVLGGHRIGEVHRAAWDVPSQQFAWDLLPLGTDGWRVLNGPPDDLRAVSFAGFGWPVTAPAKGTVVHVCDGYEDIVASIGQYPINIVPFLQQPNLAAGNHVVIQHENGVHSCLAHLRNGSLRVRVGQAVTADEIIAELGNSGFSSGPHLHLHFMDGPNLLAAQPLPVALMVEGNEYAPLTGEIISR